jgi:hypothetical protein
LFRVEWNGGVEENRVLTRLEIQPIIALGRRALSSKKISEGLPKDKDRV